MRVMQGRDDRSPHHPAHPHSRRSAVPQDRNRRPVRAPIRMERRPPYGDLHVRLFEGAGYYWAGETGNLINSQFPILIRGALPQKSVVTDPLPPLAAFPLMRGRMFSLKPKDLVKRLSAS